MDSKKDNQNVEEDDGALLDYSYISRLSNLLLLNVSVFQIVIRSVQFPELPFGFDFMSPNVAALLI